jgi:hypothetical protein
VGAFFTICTFPVFAAYTYGQIDYLLFNWQLNISSLIIGDYFDASHQFDFNDNEFRIAFTVQSATAPFENKNSSDFVEWNPELVISKDVNSEDEPLDYHLCTPEDYELFFPPFQEDAIGIR